MKTILEFIASKKPNKQIKVPVYRVMYDPKARAQAYGILVDNEDDIEFFIKNSPDYKHSESDTLIKTFSNIIQTFNAQFLIFPFPDVDGGFSWVPSNNLNKADIVGYITSPEDFCIKFWKSKKWA